MTAPAEIWAELQPETLAAPNGFTEGQWLHAYEGPARYATVEELCGTATWEGK